MFPFIRELWSKRKSVFSEDASESPEIIPSDRLRQYGVEQSKDQGRIILNRPQTLQEGFYESIQIMRNISTHLEEQAKTQKQMIEAIPMAMNSVNRNLQVSEASQKRMHEALDGLSQTLNLIHKSHHQHSEQLEQQVKKQNFLLILASSGLILLAITAILTPVFFSYKISHILSQQPGRSPTEAPAHLSASSAPVVTLTQPNQVIHTQQVPAIIESPKPQVHIEAPTDALPVSHAGNTQRSAATVTPEPTSQSVTPGQNTESAPLEELTFEFKSSVPSGGLTSPIHSVEEEESI